nr:MAG TPA: hypothetical protein [Caudoviricetes sp.]
MHLPNIGTVVADPEVLQTHIQVLHLILSLLYRKSGSSPNTLGLNNLYAEVYIPPQVYKLFPYLHWLIMDGTVN